MLSKFFVKCVNHWQKEKAQRRSSIKTNSNFSGLYVCKSYCALYDNFVTYIMRDSPADDSVGVCSVL